jgi:hypothetical protein
MLGARIDQLGDLAGSAHPGGNAILNGPDDNVGTDADNMAYGTPDRRAFGTARRLTDTRRRGTGCGHLGCAIAYDFYFAWRISIRYFRFHS